MLLNTIKKCICNEKETSGRYDLSLVAGLFENVNVDSIVLIFIKRVPKIYNNKHITTTLTRQSKNIIAPGQSN